MFSEDAVVYSADSTYIEYKTNEDFKPHLGSIKQCEICFNIYFYFKFNTWYFFKWVNERMLLSSCKNIWLYDFTKSKYKVTFI